VTSAGPALLELRGYQLMSEDRRALVEEMSVVDEDGHRLSVAPTDDRPPRLAQHLAAVGARSQVGKEASEGAEWQCRRSLRGAHPQRHVVALRFR
jgi:hypothetical protein